MQMSKNLNYLHKILLSNNISYNVEKSFHMKPLNSMSLRLYSDLCIKSLYSYQLCPIFLLPLNRNFHNSSILSHDVGPADRVMAGYNHRRSRMYREIRKPTVENLKAGFEHLKNDIRLWKGEMKTKFEADIQFVRPGDVDKVFDFKTEDDLSKWVVTTDKDNKIGQSSASLTLSPTGHGLFSGHVDTTLPDDGITQQTGFANITCLQPMRSFDRESVFDWTQYNHLVLRIRSDGRRYMLILDTAGYYDTSWYDMYFYVLYTRGGPYWQDVKIPFSKFIFSPTGRLQDKQQAVVLDRIKRLGITAADDVNAPFRLEIDYIAVEYDPSHKEEFAYEMNQVPAHIVF